MPIYNTAAKSLSEMIGVTEREEKIKNPDLGKSIESIIGAVKGFKQEKKKEKEEERNLKTEARNFAFNLMSKGVDANTALNEAKAKYGTDASFADPQVMAQIKAKMDQGQARATEKYELGKKETNVNIKKKEAEIAKIGRQGFDEASRAWQAGDMTDKELINKFPTKGRKLINEDVKYRQTAQKSSAPKTLSMLEKAVVDGFVKDSKGNRVPIEDEAGLMRVLNAYEKVTKETVDFNDPELKRIIDLIGKGQKGLSSAKDETGIFGNIKDAFTPGEQKNIGGVRYEKKEDGLWYKS